MSTSITRRSFMKAVTAGAALSVAAPWSAPWAYPGVSGRVRDYGAAVPNAYADLALDLIQSTPGFTPPVASRVLGHMGVALYESLVPGMIGFRSLSGLLPDFPTVPTTPRSSFHWPTVANASLATILRRLFPSTAPRLGGITALEKFFDAEFSSVPAPVRRRSVERGRTVAEMAYDWSKGDGGHDGHLTNFPAGYVSPVGPGLWEPTPPAFQPIPLQPFWGSNRPFADTPCVTPPPPAYSTDPSSDFYAFALEVHDTVNNLTAEQETIALFWADDPGTFTPPGHSLSMLRQVLTAEEASLALAAEAYLRVGCAVADAFIQCWHIKYVWNLLRPATYIRANFDPSWISLVPTPPFPEYSSGHSTQSGAWAEVMTSLFGDGHAFTDHSHDASGFAPRTFSSFSMAAEEAAVSRIYGGIHYRFANENGLAAGICVGRAAASIPIRAT